MKNFLKKILLLVVISSFAILPILADETDVTVEEIHNVQPTQEEVSPTPIAEEALVNKDGLESFEAPAGSLDEKIENDLAEQLDVDLDDEEDIDEENLDEENLDEEDLDEEDLDDEDLDDDDDFGEDDEFGDDEDS